MFTFYQSNSKMTSTIKKYNHSLTNKMEHNTSQIDKTSDKPK